MSKIPEPLMKKLQETVLTEYSDQLNDLSEYEKSAFMNGFVSGFQQAANCSFKITTSALDGLTEE